MELSLNKIKNLLPKGIIAQAGKNTVRECDEIEMGHFQAYVDEKDKSFDVSVSLDDGGELTDHSCDCKSKHPICQHKAALLLYIVKGKKARPSSGNNKKNSQLGYLVDEVDVDKLRIWIKELLAKNKDLELAFIHQFANQQKKYTPADVKRLTLDAVKAVVKGRKKAEASEVKKIVELWADMHDSFVNQYCNHPSDDMSFLNFHAIIEAVEETQLKIITSSNRFNKYLENKLSGIMASLHNLREEEAWHITTGYFLDRIHDGPFRFRLNYLSFLVNLLVNSHPERKKLLLDRLLKQYATCDPSTLYNGAIYTETMFHMVMENDLFDQYYDILKPIRFNNEYNFDLITELIESGYLRLAEKYCQEQIKGNFREEFNLLYLQLLREIYVREKDDSKLSEVLMELFPQTYNFEDYLFIIARIADEEETKKWRSKILARARQASHHPAAMDFSFKLMDYEKKYKKMIEYINEYTSYNLIARYAEKMVLTDKNGLLKAILHKYDSLYQIEDETTVSDLTAIVDISYKHCSKEEIELVINHAGRSGWSFKPNMLIAYIKGL
jgi:hypothetical protein